MVFFIPLHNVNIQTSFFKLIEKSIAAQKDRSEHKRSTYGIYYKDTLQCRMVFLDTALNKASSNYRLFHMMMLKEKKKFSKYIFRARRLSQVKVWESEKRNYLELQEVFALSL